MRPPLHTLYSQPSPVAGRQSSPRRLPQARVGPFLAKSLLSADVRRNLARGVHPSASHRLSGRLMDLPVQHVVQQVKEDYAYLAPSGRCKEVVVWADSQEPVQ